jgi:glutathione S-transferase
LEAKYSNQGTKLVPTHDIKANALFEQAVSIEQHNFDPFASKIVAEKVFKPYVFLLSSFSKKLKVYRR